MQKTQLRALPGDDPWCTALAEQHSPRCALSITWLHPLSNTTTRSVPSSMGEGHVVQSLMVDKSNLSTCRNYSVILLHVGHAWRLPWIALSLFLQRILSADCAEVGFQRTNGAALPVISLGAPSWCPSTAMGRDLGDTGAVGARKQGKKMMCASKMRAEWGLG